MRARIFAEENRRWWTLGSLCFALFMIMLDNTVVNVALPAIKADLGISTAELEWTVAAYALTFASLLLTPQYATAAERLPPRVSPAAAARTTRRAPAARRGTSSEIPGYPRR